jgi:hypothetical protein
LGKARIRKPFFSSPVSRRFFLSGPMALPRSYPPFGFSVFYDRHGGGWTWRERRPSGNEDDNTTGSGLSSRAEGIAACRAELRRRGARDTGATNGVDST